MGYFNKSQNGVSLYLAIAILAILLGIALGVSSILFGQMRTISSLGYSVVAFYSADSGIEQELYERNPAGSAYACFVDLDGVAATTCSNISTCPANLTAPADACYQVTVITLTQIRSFGYYREVRRAIEISF